MEARTAVSVAELAVYDMCKAVDRNIVISDETDTGIDQVRRARVGKICMGGIERGSVA